jgi:hypothetical protein
MSSKINPTDFLLDAEDEREFRIARLSARNKKKLLSRPVVDEEETLSLDRMRDTITGRAVLSDPNMEEVPHE